MERIVGKKSAGIDPNRSIGGATNRLAIASTCPPARRVAAGKAERTMRVAQVNTGSWPDEGTDRANVLDGGGNTRRTMVDEAVGRSVMNGISARSGALWSSWLPERAHGLAACDAQLAGDGELPVLAYEALEIRLGTRGLIDQLRVRLGFPPEVFARAVLPVIERYVEFVQLLPAPWDERHMFAGGLCVRSMEVGTRALDYRRAHILPRGAAPEVIGAQAHRWTYAVFTAALIYEAGRALAGLRVRILGGAAGETWDPQSGPMTECGVVSYRVEIAGDVMSETPRALPPRLLKHLVPSSVLEWLAVDADLMPALSDFLSGNGLTAAGAIGELVLRASGSAQSRDAPRGVQEEPPLPQTAPAQAVASAHANTAYDDSPAGSATAGFRLACVTASGAEDQEEYLEDFEVAGRRSAKSATLHPSMSHGSDVAIGFMAWLRESVADGTLSVNAPGSLVHFVPEGMLLVSPRILREFAKWCSERGAVDPAHAGSVAEIGKSIQREVLRARWHLRAPNGVNICTYDVIRHGRAVSRIAGVVLPNPERFVDHVPVVNSALVRIRADEPAR